MAGWFELVRDEGGLATRLDTIVLSILFEWKNVDDRLN